MDGFAVEINSYPNEDFLTDCLAVIKTYPLFSIAGAAGKFTPNYAVWCFHINSPHPLIQKIQRICQENSELLEQKLGFAVRTDLVRICYSHDRSRKMCLWHRDGLYWNGQLHLTVLGGANIGITAVRENETFHLEGLRIINKEPGTFWYLNSTEYVHKILTSKNKSPRIEITLPVNIPQRFLDYYERHRGEYSDDCYVYTPEIDQLIRYNKQSRLNGLWSSDKTPSSNTCYYTDDYMQADRLYFFNDFLEIYESSKASLEESEEEFAESHS